jgi:hypothetical protein
MVTESIGGGNDGVPLYVLICSFLKSHLTLIPSDENTSKSLMNSTVVTFDVCMPLRTAMHSPVTILQTRTVVSQLPDAAIFIFGLKAIALIPCECPSKTLRHSPFEAFHSLTVVSALPDRIRVPSGENNMTFMPKA